MRKLLTASSLMVAMGLGFAGFAGSCAEGLEPPATTAMAEIRSGLDFTFGSDAWCFNENVSVAQRATCDGDSGVQFPIIWPTVKVRLQPFAIDIHEVTNVQYRYCVAMGVCQGGDDSGHPNNAIELEQTNYYDNPTFDDFPIVRATWAQAQEYCTFVGKRLPTEVEWERVARGPDSVNRPYPTDDLASLSECVGNQNYATLFCRNNRRLDRVMHSEVDVVTESNGTKIYQMFGNAAEWTANARRDDLTCAGPGLCARVDECPSGASGDVCREQSKNCAACPKDGGNPSRNIQSDTCNFMCLGEPRETIVCTPYAASAQPVAESELASGTGHRIVRGGSISTSESSSCQMGVSFRSRLLDGTSAREGDVGFRCARKLN